MALTARAGLLGLISALGVGLLLPSWTGVLVGTGAILALCGIDLLTAGSIRSLTIVRKATGNVRLGEPAETTLVITNPGRRAVRGVLRDAWVPSAGAATDRHPLRVPAGERRSISTALLPTRRGDRRADRVTVRSLGRLGLAARQRSVDAGGVLRVLPPFHSRKHLPARLARLRELDGRRASLVRGAGTEFDSLREYVIGDDVRSIDWRATARAADVMVRTWRPERSQRVLIVLDTGRLSAGRVGDAPRLDAAMDATLLLSVLATQAGDRVDFLAVDRRVRASVPGAALPDTVNAMAPLEPELVETDYRLLTSEILRRARQRALVVLLTGLDSGAIRQGLLPVLPMLTARHRVVLGAVGDPAIGALAQGRDTVQAVYEAAAAERTLAERRELTRLLGTHGVQVVDAEPDQLPPRLSDMYLALKAGGTR
ncbi:DUF58 domain-containing protein [Pseudonocardiaceae bacterium YIM PH 21723]|nr:DUF58 domain-containing protein [Pseudonocardiaceae bacterium YIM PH 21723]